ncbi:MAG: hypothetical protein H6Q11_74 [Acidobacteria bacterium]|nr:hypothetical protein [Acidobacteriota bacterium]
MALIAWRVSTSSAGATTTMLAIARMIDRSSKIRCVFPVMPARRPA